MKKILFFIHDLGGGGAEKVLVNLVNNMDKNKYNITVISLFSGGTNEQYLDSEIKYQTVFKKTFPGNSRIMKFFSPRLLHKFCVKEHFDIEISFLEGPSTRIIGGCPDSSTRLIAWVHSTMTSNEKYSEAYRTSSEVDETYRKFDRIICVSESVKSSFLSYSEQSDKTMVLYNTLESEKIKVFAEEPVIVKTDSINLVTVGTLKEIKGFDRLLRIVKKLAEEKFSFHLYILGNGPLENEFKQYIQENGLQNIVSLMGYQENPYKFVKKCDLFVCSSYSEGFSTAATEALIVGTPVCTVDVSGMREMLGNNEYGIITKNDENSLYEGIKNLLINRDLLRKYKTLALLRGKDFEKEKTVSSVENMLMDLDKRVDL